VVQYPVDLPAGVMNAIDGAEWTVLADRGVDLAQDSGKILGANQIHPQQGVLLAQEIPCRMSRQRQNAVRHHRDAPGRPQLAAVDRTRNVAGQRAEHLFTFRQGIRRPLALADVPGDAEHAADPPLAVAQWALGGQECPLAERRIETFLARLDPLAGNDALADRHQLQRLVFREKSPVVVAEHVRGLPADVTAGSAVEKQIAALAILGVDGVVRVVGDGLQQFQGSLPFLQHRDLFPVRGVDPAHLAPDQQVQQQGGDGDEQPALEHADADDLLGTGVHGLDRMVRQQDPECGEHSVDRYDRERRLAGRSSIRQGLLSRHACSGSRYCRAMLTNSSKRSTKAFTMSGSKCRPQPATMMSRASAKSIAGL